MRIPQFISPSALAKYQDSVETYYLYYLAENPPPREPQSQAMSVGSGFDAFVKSYLFEKVMGKKDDQFELNTIFETQVEEHNRDFAWDAGQHCFEQYKDCGALADLLVELENARNEPRFEFTVRGNIEGVEILGKPDVWYVNNNGVPIILDWKVNGYCSNYPVSPKRGYIRVRGPGNNQDGEHKKAQISKINGVKVNIAEFFEAIEKSWAQQLATYAWLCGAIVGSFFIVAIDQLCCNATGSGKPVIRVAEHRSQIGPEFQRETLSAYKELWAVIHEEPFHYFKDRTFAESKQRCDVLDTQYAAYTDGENWISDLMR